MMTCIMARPKKYGTYLNACSERLSDERLELVCVDAGQTETVTPERALTAYLVIQKIIRS